MKLTLTTCKCGCGSYISQVWMIVLIFPVDCNELAVRNFSDHQLSLLHGNLVDFNELLTLWVDKRNPMFWYIHSLIIMLVTKVRFQITVSFIYSKLASKIQFVLFLLCPAVRRLGIKFYICLSIHPSHYCFKLTT